MVGLQMVKLPNHGSIVVTWIQSC